MQLSRTLATLFTLASVQGYVITIFDDKGCTGNNKRVNVWDNTCRDGDVLNTKSFRVEKYGGSRQVADIYPSNSCGTVRVASWAADGGSDMFKQDRCLDLPEPARAFGSRSG